MTLLLLIVLALGDLPGPECKTVSASRLLTVQTGGALIIPCYYDRKYTEHKKYWCFDDAAAFNYCSILAYANETKGKVSVIDHPDQSFFTLTLRNLQHGDTGDYWCTVEIGGIFQSDEREQLQLTVQSVPDVSVVNSSVSGQEGGDISVQCLYSSGYKNKLKQWCRYKDQRCYKEKKTDTSQNSSVQISDDGKGSFTVLMTGLRLTDSGWYYCSVGKLEAPFQLNVSENSQVSVTEPKPEAVITEGFQRNGDSTALSSTTPVSVNINQTASSEEQQNEHYLYLEVWIPAVVLLMVIVIVVSAVILKKKHNRNELVTEMNRVGASDAGNGASSSSEFAENDVTYTSVIVRPKTKARSPVSVKDEVTYSSVHKQVKTT